MKPTLTLTPTQIEKLEALAAQHGWKLNRHFIASRNAIAFQVSGDFAFRLIYRPLETRCNSELRSQSYRPILDEVIRIVKAG